MFTIEQYIFSVTKYYPQGSILEHSFREVVVFVVPRSKVTSSAFLSVEMEHKKHVFFSDFEYEYRSKIFI